MSNILKKITKENYAEVENGVAVLDFWAEWCGPCKMLAPVFESVALKLGDKVAFCKVNVDEANDIAGAFGISAIPTVIVLKDGEEIARNVGYMNEEKLESFVIEALN